MTTGISVDEAISEFYRLKGKYEEYYQSSYIKPLLKTNSTLSKKEKKLYFSKLTKPPCINCKRNVGTIFSVKQVDYTYRNFVAKCGDITEPCPLNININYALREPMDASIEKELKNIEKIKLNIIKEKNNILFFEKGVPSQTIMANFEKLTNELTETTKMTGFLIEKNILTNDNPVKYNLLKKTIDEFGKEMLLPFKNMISDFMTSDNELIASEAVRFYNDEMVPKLKEIQNLKYDVTFVEYDKDDKSYILVQKKTSLENNEATFGSEDKVVSFVKGIKKKSSKTLKAKEKEPAVTKSKTRKVKETEIDFEIEEGEEDKEKKEYMRIYNKLPQLLRDEFNKYPEWQNEFIESCVQSRKEQKPCVFSAPKNVTLPPTLLESGQYDFGFGPYNEIFNQQAEGYKKVLLSLFKVGADGNKDYSKLTETLDKLLAKKFGVNYSEFY